MEEMAKFHSSSDSSYASIPSSPRSKSSSSFNSNPIHFFSEPTSPTRTSASDFPFLWELEKEQLIKISPPGDNSDSSFEFKTSATNNFNTPLKFVPHQPELLNHKTEQAISFADQLFHNGKILPLKPPPRFQYTDDNNAKSASEKSVLKSSFTCWSFNKSDFDPFMAALEHVKKEEGWKNYQGSPPMSRRRSRSLSPMRASSPSHWAANSNEHSTAWNTKKHSNRRHRNLTPTRSPEPDISASKIQVERPINKPTTLAVFPGRTVKVVSVHKKYKRVNFVKGFLLLKMECLGGGKGRL